MRLYSIASGSSGNSIYIESEKTKLLVDAGITAKRIESGLEALGIHGNELDGILITHEHIDHIRGLEVFTKRYHTPIYGTKETLQTAIRASGAGEAMDALFHLILPKEPFTIGDIDIMPFPTSHDACNPVCYSCSSNGHKIGMATDLGCYTQALVDCLSESEILYLEANYDLNMLMAGSYPYQLKRRISGDRGHLSNEMSSQLICRLLNKKLKHIVLAHMSKENNYAELAYETIRQAVSNAWQWEDELPQIRIASRDIPTEPVSI